jgi:multicomponent Na+:H+ antiporter subunit D
MAPLAIAIPLLVACLLLALGGWIPRGATDLLALGAAAGCLINAVIMLVSGQRVVYWVGGWSTGGGHGVGIPLVADQAAAGLAALIALLTFCALLYSWRYFDSAEAHFPVLVLLFMTGMTGFVLVGDLFTMFVSFELMGAVGYALAGYKIEEPDSVQGAFTFGVTNSIGAYFALTGVALLYARTGQLGLAQLGTSLSGKPADALVRLGFALVFAGWLVKAAAVPFHFWLADAHAVAPSPVCVLFSGVMAPLGVYGVARVYWVAGAGVIPASAVRIALLSLGILTAVLGAIMAATQRHLKRMLAYSTIAHSGLFLIAVASLDAEGIAGAGTYLLGHAGVKGALFLLVGLLLAVYGSVDEIDLHGRARRHRVLGGLFVLAGLALAGLPPFGTGLGKAVAEEATGNPLLVALFVVVSAVTGGVVLRAGFRVYFDLGRRRQTEDGLVTPGSDELPEVDHRLRKAPPTMLAAVVILLGLGLAVGTLPGLGARIGAAAGLLADPTGYRSSVLAGSQALGGQVDAGWHPEGLLLAGLSTVVAIGVAAVSLYARPVAAFHGPVRLLHRVHSGHIGDYVAWLTLGVALLSGTMLAFQ